MGAIADSKVSKAPHGIKYVKKQNLAYPSELYVYAIGKVTSMVELAAF